MVFGLVPLWVKKIRENGVAATAVVLGDPHNKVKKYQKCYEGRGKWLEIKVSVQALAGTVYTADMTCQMSQIIFGLLESDMTVKSTIRLSWLWCICRQARLFSVVAGTMSHFGWCMNRIRLMN